MRQRIQKVLASQGIASRREVEAWIAAGRLSVNGEPAAPGAAIGPGDDVRLDGRRLRLQWRGHGEPEGLLYHRPSREGLRTALADGERSTLDRLPRARTGRWVAVSPMGAGESGLELFVTDGRLAAALMGRADALSSEYSLRVRGNFDEERVADVLKAASEDVESGGKIERLEYIGGEGANRWAQVAVVGLRPRDLKRIFERCGIEVNRIIRTRIGELSMDRSLARGVSRRLTRSEMQSLAVASGLGRDASAAAPARPRRQRQRQPGRATGSRKPRR